jgi:hypothetical protein
MATFADSINNMAESGRRLASTMGNAATDFVFAPIKGATQVMKSFERNVGQSTGFPPFTDFLPPFIPQMAQTLNIPAPPTPDEFMSGQFLPKSATPPVLQGLMENIPAPVDIFSSDNADVNAAAVERSVAESNYEGIITGVGFGEIRG